MKADAGERVDVQLTCSQNGLEYCNPLDTVPPALSKTLG